MKAITRVHCCEMTSPGWEHSQLSAIVALYGIESLRGSTGHQDGFTPHWPETSSAIVTDTAENAI
jgi:hypothetical protein